MRQRLRGHLPDGRGRVLVRRPVEEQAMHPVLAYGVRAYPLFLALAPLTAALAAAAWLRGRGIAVHQAVAVGAWLFAGGVGGAKIWALLERGALAMPTAGDLLDGYRQPGAAVGVAVALALCRPRWTGVSRRALGDAVAIGACAGLVVFRIGCFLNGCCSGIPCSLPWCLRYPVNSSVWATHVVNGLVAPDSAASLPVHPLPLYFALLALCIGAFLLRLARRGVFDGHLLLVFLAAEGTGKFLLEFLRATPAPAVQAAALVIGVTALVLLAAARQPRTGLLRLGFR
jgi:phosphatidylglycerol:prolipoprotein diacylglycerol transferase